MVTIKITTEKDDEIEDVVALIQEHLNWLIKDFSPGILPIGGIEYGTGKVVYEDTFEEAAI